MTLILGFAAFALGATAAVVRITLRDQVSRVKLAKGDVLEVCLDLTDGKVTWVVDRIPAFLSLSSGPSTQPAEKGVPAYQTFRFDAVSSGDDMLTVKLVNPATPAAPPVKQFTVTVSILK